jgi:nitrogen regulatory protein P-II 1
VLNQIKTQKMKKIEAIIRSLKFEEVKEALHSVGVDFFTYIDVKGIGKQKTQEAVYRGSHYDVGSIARKKLEIVVNDNMVDNVVKAILSSATTGETGDGKIFITDVDKAIRIRTGETGDAAL